MIQIQIEIKFWLKNNSKVFSLRIFSNISWYRFYIFWMESKNLIEKKYLTRTTGLEGTIQNVWGLGVEPHVEGEDPKKVGLGERGPTNILSWEPAPRKIVNAFFFISVYFYSILWKKIEIFSKCDQNSPNFLQNCEKNIYKEYFSISKNIYCFHHTQHILNIQSYEKKMYENGLKG